MQFPEIVKVSADPAAGGEIVYVADEDCIVHSVIFQLVTNATVVNRRVSLVADDGSTVFWRQATNYDQTASLTNVYCAFEGGALGSGGGSTTFMIPTGGLRLRKGDRLSTLTSNLNAGDNYGALVLQVERES